jgi:CheY-like chemotaxis protein
MPKKILVADDSVVIQKSIGISFAQEDFQVTFVGNGEEAFQRAKEVKPDLILADTSMPKLSGAELCKKFRQDADFRRTPILLLASTQETFNPGQLKACGANDFIQKPFESSALIEKVRALFSQAPEVTGATHKVAAMEQSIDQAFSRAPAPAPEEDTAIAFAPQAPVVDPFNSEKSDDFAPDMMSAYSNPTPSPNTLASLDVLSMDISEEHGDDMVQYEEEEKTKTVAPDAIFNVQSNQTASRPPEPVASAPVAAPTELTLSEQQIEQIVSKVFKNVIERIAWEVVPEMAERIIKEELKKITDDQ